MPKQKVKVGDVFWVPLEDNSFSLGQIVENQREVLNCITCVFYAQRVHDTGNISPSFEHPISCQFVTRDLFNSGVWKRIGNWPIQIKQDMLPYREAQKNGWIGATMLGSGNINKFLAAFFGLRDWHEMHDPEYYQKLLLEDLVRKPCV